MLIRAPIRWRIIFLLTLVLPEMTFRIEPISAFAGQHPVDPCQAENRIAQTGPGGHSTWFDTGIPPDGAEWVRLDANEHPSAGRG